MTRRDPSAGNFSWPPSGWLGCCFKHAIHPLKPFRSHPLKVKPILIGITATVQEKSQGPINHSPLLDYETPHRAATAISECQGQLNAVTVKGVGSEGLPCSNISSNIEAW